MRISKSVDRLRTYRRPGVGHGGVLETYASVETVTEVGRKFTAADATRRTALYRNHDSCVIY